MRETGKDFAVKRFMRIFPALFVAIFLSYILFHISSKNNFFLPGINPGGFWHWFSALFLMDGFVLPYLRVINITWTLVVEIVFYIMTFIYIAKSKTSPIKANWYMIIFWVVLALLSMKMSFFAGNATIIKFIAFLLIGRTIYLWYTKLISIADSLLCFTLIIFVFCLFAEYSSPGYLLLAGYEPAASYVLAVGIFMGMLRLSPKRVMQPFKFFGNISYSLYLFHLPVGMFVLNILYLKHVSASLSSIIAIAISIVVATISYYLIELPSQRLARKLVVKRREL